MARAIGSFIASFLLTLAVYALFAFIVSISVSVVLGIDFGFMQGVAFILLILVTVNTVRLAGGVRP